MLAGRMMDFPLTLTHFLRRAETFFPRSEVVSRRPDKSFHRYTYADMGRRIGQLANALSRLGVKPGDRVATFAWNHNQHLELYLGVPAMGAVVHTLNLRLHPSEVGYIANHAEDSVVVVDRSLLPLFEKFAGGIRSLRHVIVVPDCPPPDASALSHRTTPSATPLATTPLASPYLDYEELIAREDSLFAFPDLDENAAAMLCYTSGTTGNPKGVLYSHRSCVLHTLMGLAADTLAVSENDTIMPVVPMFHAAAWGLPFMAVAAGASLVFPGPHLDAVSLLDTMVAERITVAGGVPTIWLGILAQLDASPDKWDLRKVRTMVIGGSAAPPALIDGFQKRHNLLVTHAWGMTETNPLGTLARLRRGSAETRDDAQQLHLRASQGYAVAFVEQRHSDDTGRILPWDGATMGELEVRGPWVASSYFGDEGKERFTADGWFKTGDVVTIDADGYVRITDRSKDVIKSGGEWISSVALENALMSHPAVLEAAVFAAAHPKWDERPVAAIVLKEGRTVTDAELLLHLAPHFAHFWMPDAFVYPPQIPRTSTGKFLKSRLRELYGHVLQAPSQGS